MPHKLTRRDLAVALSASTALFAQTPNAPLTQNSDEELQAVRKQLAQNAQQLATVDLPMSTEPAVHFKA
ncbi:MAG TPA: hypothetical protein VGV35_20470 [Bryobacteraceae bacterium]|nr:hypothetical protein [Bryobacteraceae bacterium]